MTCLSTTPGLALLSCKCADCVAAIDAERAAIRELGAYMLKQWNSGAPLELKPQAYIESLTERVESRLILEAERRADGGVTGAGRLIDWQAEEACQQDIAERFT